MENCHSTPVSSVMGPGTVAGDFLSDRLLWTHNLVIISVDYCGCKLPPMPAATPLRANFPSQ